MTLCMTQVEIELFDKNTPGESLGNHGDIEIEDVCINHKDKFHYYTRILKGDTVIGFFQCSDSYFPDVKTIDNALILPQYCGVGNGSIALGILEEHLKSFGYKAIMLEDQSEKETIQYVYDENGKHMGFKRSKPTFWMKNGYMPTVGICHKYKNLVPGYDYKNEPLVQDMISCFEE